MRRRLIMIAVVVVVVVVVAIGVIVASQGDNVNENRKTSSTFGLETRRLTVRGVDIEIKPLRLDDQEAVFAVSLDTHELDLSADLTRSTLDVDGTVRPAESWSGDGPGGHHREGQLRFRLDQRLNGSVTLALSGFTKPAEASWEIPD